MDSPAALRRLRRKTSLGSEEPGANPAQRVGASETASPPRRRLVGKTPSDAAPPAAPRASDAVAGSGIGAEAGSGLRRGEAAATPVRRGYGSLVSAGRSGSAVAEEVGSSEFPVKGRGKGRGRGRGRESGASGQGRGGGGGTRRADAATEDQPAAVEGQPVRRTSARLAARAELAAATAEGARSSRAALAADAAEGREEAARNRGIGDPREVARMQRRSSARARLEEAERGGRRGGRGGGR